jgi:hypothetical protein
VARGVAHGGEDVASDVAYGPIRRESDHLRAAVDVIDDRLVPVEVERYSESA